MRHLKGIGAPPSPLLQAHPFPPNNSPIPPLPSIDLLDEELAELNRHAGANPLSRLLANPRWKEESAIDFAHTSAQIEGNTYSHADTITLLKMGRTAGGKSFVEAQMIVNLRSAYELVLGDASALVHAGVEGVRRIHSVLMRGILPDDQLGATRKTRRVRISGTEYRPPDAPPYLDKQAARVQENIVRAANPFDASVYAACALSCLQLFEDGNKRTSRVFQIAILIASAADPVPCFDDRGLHQRPADLLRDR
ncbi:Fic family protein [Variovorax sp. J22P271]|uniref:Fic family protein n=1 Tax=Variovorax davisae TaxID=3053515 RepID=UPI002577D599|nr:Fic family protein [Variovorax sp. J22P271]MDM0032049.1 Fic family protein [Variovorax sp. J22P271]